MNKTNPKTVTRVFVKSFGQLGRSFW